MNWRSLSTYFVFNVISAALPIATLPIFTRYLTPDDLGHWALFSVYTMYISNFMRFELNTALKQAFSTQAHTAPRLLSSASLGAMILWCLGMGVVGAASIIWPTVDGLATPWFAVMVTLGSCRFFSVCLHHLLQLRGQATAYGLWGLGINLGQLALALALLISAGMGWQARAWAELSVAIVTLPLVIHFLRRDFGLKWAFDSTELWAATRLSAPLLVSSTIGYVLSTTDRLAIDELQSKHELGLYAIAVQLSAALALFQGALLPTWESWIYARGQGVHSSNIGFLLRRLAVIACTLFAMALMGTPILQALLPYLADERYALASTLVLPALCVAAASGLYALMQPMAVYLRKTTPLAIIQVLTLLVAWPLARYLVQVAGTAGAAWAMVICHLGASLALAVLLWRWARNTTSPQTPSTSS